MLPLNCKSPWNNCWLLAPHNSFVPPGEVFLRHVGGRRSGALREDVHQEAAASSSRRGVQIEQVCKGVTGSLQECQQHILCVLVCFFFFGIPYSIMQSSPRTYILFRIFWGAFVGLQKFHPWLFKDSSYIYFLTISILCWHLSYCLCDIALYNNILFAGQVMKERGRHEADELTKFILDVVKSFYFCMFTQCVCFIYSVFIIRFPVVMSNTWRERESECSL